MDPPSRGVESVRKHGTYDGLLGWKDGESMNINLKKQLESVNIIYVIDLFAFGMILTNMIRTPLSSESPCPVLSDWLFLVF